MVQNANVEAVSLLKAVDILTLSLSSLQTVENEGAEVGGRRSYINAACEWIGSITLQHLWSTFPLRQHSTYGGEIPLTCTQKWELKYPMLSQCYGRIRQLTALQSHGASWPYSQDSLIGSMASGNLLDPCEQQFPQHKAGWTELLCEKMWKSFKGNRESLRAPRNCPPPPRISLIEDPLAIHRDMLFRDLLIKAFFFPGRSKIPLNQRKCGCSSQLCLQEAVG